MKKISIVIPCYNEEDSILNFYNEVTKIFNTNKNFTVDFIFVNDGSKDNTLLELQKLNKRYKNANYISFSTNFGKEYAMLAGLENAQGDYISVMDVDLQEPPELLIEMALKLGEGYDSIGTYRSDRKGEPIFKTIFGNIFYYIVSKTTKLDMHPGARDFRLMNRKYLNAVLSVKENNRFLKGIFGYIGFKTTWIGFENRNRTIGESKFSLIKVVKYYFDTFIMYSNFLFNLILKASLLFFTIAFVLAIFNIIAHPSNIIAWLFSFVSFTTGVITLSIYIVSLYISKVYKETRKNPKYIIGESSL